MTPFNWLGLLQLIGVWLAVVLLGVFVLDWLFPRLHRGDEEPAADRNETLPWYPAMPRRAPPARLSGNLPLPLNPAYWRQTTRASGVTVLIWLAVALGSVGFAPTLNQWQVFTGFPLGYYLGAQGALIIFLGLITAYVIWAARLDRRFGRPAAGAGGDSRRIILIYLAFTFGFIGFVLLLGWLEASYNLPPAVLGWALLGVTIGLYAVIGLLSRARTLEDYYVAGRRVPAFLNGMAIAADWMSAASFISMAGTLWLLGYEGLAYILGWTGGYVLLAVLLAPYLRKFGHFTIPDFIAARYDGAAARIVAAIIGVLISFTYVTAQVTGIGLIMARFLGVNYLAGVLIGLGAVLFCSYLGGMRAITWTQVAQVIVLLIAYLVPVTLLSLQLTGVPFPQLMYGQALQHIAQLEAPLGLTAAYATPFNDWTPWNFTALMLCLMAGTAGLPHILVRFYTTPDAGAARRSAGWALVFILALYLTAPAYAAFSRWEILQNVVGKPIGAAPEWAVNWANAGLLTLQDLNGDGVLQFNELRIDPDLIVLATPEIAGLPHVVAALVAAGGLAAALSTADGLLMVIASALAHDLYRTVNPQASARERLLLGRIMVLVAAVVAAVVASRRLGLIVQLVAGAFSLAAATFFPVLVLGIFWKRANGRGAVAGMLAGLAATLSYMLVTTLTPDFSLLGIGGVAAGIFGLPVNFLVTALVSALTPPPSLEAQTLVDELRQP